MQPNPPGEATLSNYRWKRIAEPPPPRSGATSALIKANRRFEIIPSVCRDCYQLLTGNQFWDDGFKLSRRTRERSATALWTKRNQACHHLKKREKGAGTDARLNKWPTPRHGEPVAPAYGDLNKNLDRQETRFKVPPWISCASGIADSKCRGSA